MSALAQHGTRHQTQRGQGMTEYIIIVALIANNFWKTGLLRGLLPLVVTTGVTLLIELIGLCRERRKALPHIGDTRRQPDLRVDRNRDQTVRPRISRANASGS